mgnify:CR=1 FL=1
MAGTTTTAGTMVGTMAGIIIGTIIGTTIGTIIIIVNILIVCFIYYNLNLFYFFNKKKLDYCRYTLGALEKQIFCQSLAFRQANPNCC